MRITYNDSWELGLSETTPTTLPITEPHSCKKGLHNLSLPQARLKDGRCRQCRRDREHIQAASLYYRKGRLSLIRRIASKRQAIRLLEEELDRIIHNAKKIRNRNGKSTSY